MRNQARNIAVLWLILGCAPPKPAPTPADSPEKITYAEVTARIAGFIDQGFVVSHGGDRHHGDSLLFTGLAAYSLPCAEGAVVADGMATMLATGGYYRFPGDSDAVSLDQLLGLYRGVAARVRRCGERERWKGAFATASIPDIPAGFDYVRQKLMALLGIGNEPAPSLQAEMEISAAGWTALVNADHAACYRAHLSLISLQMVEEMGGKISSEGRTAFCDAARGMDIATMEHWCGRPGLDEFLDNFKYNVWEYAEQRCPKWEQPDGNGLETPAVDYLVAYMDKTGG